MGNRNYTFENVWDSKVVIGGREIIAPPDNKPYIHAQLDDLHLILFWNKGSSDLDNNLHAFDGEGNLLWKVERAFPTQEISNPYVVIGFDEVRDKIILQTWFEQWVCVIDETSGAIQHMRWKDGKLVLVE